MVTRIFEFSPWVPPAVAARKFGCPDQTVRTWMRRGQAASLCLMNGTLLVCWHDVRKLARTRKAEAA
jgi:hypothetical protein